MEEERIRNKILIIAREKEYFDEMTCINKYFGEHNSAHWEDCLEKLVKEKLLEKSGNQYHLVNITGSGETISQPKTKMQKLTSMLKRILDPEAQTLYKAGYIDGNMALTQKGQEALSAILFTANKAELVKQAEEELEEEKK